MSVAKKSFVVYFDSYPLLAGLSMEQRGLLFSALMIYADRVWRAGQAGAAAAEETGGGGLLRRAGPAGPGGHGADPPADGGDEGRPPLRGDLRRVSPGPRPGSS